MRAPLLTVSAELPWCLQPYTGEQAHLNERYLTNPVIKFLSGAPPTM